MYLSCVYPPTGYLTYVFCLHRLCTSRTTYNLNPFASDILSYLAFCRCSARPSARSATQAHSLLSLSYACPPLSPPFSLHGPETLLDTTTTGKANNDNDNNHHPFELLSACEQAAEFLSIGGVISDGDVRISSPPPRLGDVVRSLLIMVGGGGGGGDTAMAERQRGVGRGDDLARFRVTESDESDGFPTRHVQVTYGYYVDSCTPPLLRSELQGRNGDVLFFLRGTVVSAR